MAVLFLFLFLAGSPVNPELQRRVTRKTGRNWNRSPRSFPPRRTANPPTPGRNTRRHSPNRPWLRSPPKRTTKGRRAPLRKLV